MKIAYLVIFGAGLVLAVHAMLHGVERWRRRSGSPSPLLNPPTVAAFLSGMGATGYLLATRTALSALAIAPVATLIGAIAFSGMTVLMARWALKAGAPMTHEADEISGQVATVSRTILPDQPGEITWFAWGRMHVLPARGIGAIDAPEGTEVVIDIIDDGVAMVEPWSVVEQRL